MIDDRRAVDMIPRRVLLLLLTILLSGLHALPASAADQVGVVRVIRGEVQAQVPGEALRQLQRGDAIFEGDHISTGDSARIAMRFNDNSRMDLGPGTETVIEEFANADSGRAPGFTTRILRGAFRFVSGLIGKRRPRSVRVRVPVATIGIRGTHFAGEVDATYARVVLLEPEEDDELTQPEARVGTPLFLAPELVHKGAQAVDQRADVWSLGVMIFIAVNRRVRSRIRSVLALGVVTFVAARNVDAGLLVVMPVRRRPGAVLVLATHHHIL